MTIEAPPLAGSSAGGPSERPQGALPAHGAAALADLPMERVNAPQPFLSGFTAGVRDIWDYRQLLGNLIRKELKVKYKGSTLGFLWSLLRPITLLLIYYIVFGKFLRSPVPGFVVFLFSGLVAWYFFQDVVIGATQAITSNAGLIKKVYFPREILPLAVVGAALVQFVIMLGVLVGLALVTGRTITPGKLALLPLAILVLIIFATAVALLLSASNVFLRDTQHLVEVVLVLWFYLTPILYSISQVRGAVAGVGSWLFQLFLANPMTAIAFGFQQAIYQRGSSGGHSVLYAGNVLARLGIELVASLIFLWFSQRVFARAQGNFAQEL